MARVIFTIVLWFVVDLAMDALARSVQSTSVSTDMLRCLALATVFSYIALEWTDELRLDVESRFVRGKLVGAAAGFAVGLVLGLRVYCEWFTLVLWK